MIYYFDTQNRSGEYRALTDEEAIAKRPKGTLILYRESNTNTGLPFVILIRDGVESNSPRKDP